MGLVKRAAPSNEEIARSLQELSLFLAMANVPWKPRAYEKAAHTIAGLDRPLSALYASGGIEALDAIPGVGEGIARRIAELLECGRCKELDVLRRSTPVDVTRLTAIEGLGPKRVKQLFDQLQIQTLDQLEQAARAGRIRSLPHFGERLEQQILRGIGFLRETQGRAPLGQILPMALEMAARLRRVPDAVHVELAGSLRRRRETIGDVDLLVASSRSESIAAAFVAMPEVVHVYARGPTKTLVRLRSGLDADLRVVPVDSWGAALCYFTGSKAHSVALRRIARASNYKLNEYGLFRGAERIAGATEQEIYAALALLFIAPELREDTGELEAARAGTLPTLIPDGALRGDLQVHSNWSDGANSMAEMVVAAKSLGLEYIAITDHTRDLTMNRGNDEERLLAQIAAIRALDGRTLGVDVLAGAEVNIRRDGSLDIADGVLAQLDVVGVGIHSDFRLSRSEMTQRLLRAIENPHVHVLFHPTGRLLGRRPPCDVDFDALLEGARRTGTALEIDAHPARLDLKDEHVRSAVKHGVKLVISSDAHAVAELRYANDYGSGVARRGWATAADILNTRPLAQLWAGMKRAHPPTSLPPQSAD